MTRERPEPSARAEPPLEIVPTSALFPPLLRAIHDPPRVLRVRGEAALLSETAVAVVGARKATGFGLEMAERLGAGLGAAGIVVVSGCAIGIDASAHRGALRVRGATVAVLAGGLDVSVPPSNRGLAARILDAGGCLTGEFPDGVPVSRWSFPRRNRIIAGLARVVVVVEAAARSGALITARLALEAGREVMVVPGHPLQPEHAGSNGLLLDGARPVTRVEDVLSEIEGLPRLEGGGTGAEVSRGAGTAATSLAARVRSGLGPLPRSAESLAAALDLPLRAVLAALTELELLGLARAYPGSRYVLPPPPEPRRRSMDATAARD